MTTTPAYVLYETQVKTVNPTGSSLTTTIAQLTGIPHGAYVVFAKAVIMSDVPQIAQVDFRLRAHASGDPDDHLDEDYASTMMRPSTQFASHMTETVALTLGVERGKPIDIEFDYEGVGPVQISDIKITAIGLDDIHFHGK